VSLQSCSDDDYPTVDGLAPTLTLSSAQLKTEPGRDFTITGVAKDADGLKSIRLVNEGLNLDKTIDFLEYYPDSLLHEYNLSYAYKGDKDWKGTESFPVEITVEDVGGRTTTQTLTVSTDGDFSNPVFTTAPSSQLTVLLQNPKLTLNATVTDNKNLGYIVVSIPELNTHDSISISGTKYDLSKVYDMPVKAASYAMTITVGDAAGNRATTSSTINVSELPDFDKMYLADVTEAADLNSDLYGVPMLIEHTGKYQYTAHYYNQKAGTPIRFIPQKTDFQPICFGVDQNGMLTSNPSEGKPITLNEIGYYEITFNTVTGEYDTQKWTPTTPSMVLDGTQTINFNDGSGNQPAQICLAGTGLPNAGNWTTNQSDNKFILTQSKTNPYILYREAKLTKGTKISFTISQTHWWGWWPEPYWRFDGSEGNEKNVKNGGDNMKEVIVPADGTYLFVFDYALLRSRFVLVK
jgi:hypothetical protein